MSLAAADAERVLSKYTPEPNTGCWLWTGGLNSKGYGQVWVNGRTRPAHRVIYQITRGPIGTGLELDHRCRVRWCVNPDHLEQVTSKENTRRGLGPSGIAMRATHCRWGHELSGINLRLVKGGERLCVACTLRRSREQRERRASPLLRAPS